MRIRRKSAPSGQIRRSRSGLLAGGALLAATMVGFAVFLQGRLLRDGTVGPAASVASKSPEIAATAVQVTLPPPDLLRPLTVEEAAQQNAERPFVARADDPAAHFVLKPGALGRLSALTCLTQAIYYEATSEGLDGGRAVAQVVLNRMRHPAYPASVCGVVYQGYERQTGCQFSFTCDGALLRIPIPAIWNRSRKIAEAALGGYVFAPVGHATYYHADYVLPYWADSLDKTIQIGRHIFYRLRGSLGERREFHQVYNGLEIVPTAAPPRLPDVIVPEPTGLPLPTVVADDLGRAQAASKPAPTEAAPRPLADIARGTLIADDGAPVPTIKRRQLVTDCTTTGAYNKPLQPLGANSTRSAAQSLGC